MEAANLSAGEVAGHYNKDLYVKNSTDLISTQNHPD